MATKMTLAEFDNKVERLLAWGLSFKNREKKWPTQKEVLSSNLDGFKSKTEVERMMRYIKDAGQKE